MRSKDPNPVTFALLCCITQLDTLQLIYYYHCYGHYTGQSVLAGTHLRTGGFLLMLSFTVHMPLLTIIGTLRLGRRSYSSPEWYYLQRLRTINTAL